MSKQDHFNSGERTVKFCYCDESGTGGSPIAVMVGVVIDSSRMRPTKIQWQGLLDTLSNLLDRQIDELHACDFYAGNTPFRGLTGDQRSNVITAVHDWLTERKHNVVYSAVNISQFNASRTKGALPSELGTVWQFLGFHLVLSMQKYGQAFKHGKGRTVYFFDRVVTEQDKFINLVTNPPTWSEAYYNKRKKDDPLDQVLEVPAFVDSKQTVLIQVADLFAFGIRRYAELCEGFGKPKYKEELDKLTMWCKLFAQQSIGRQHIYPRQSVNAVQQIFLDHAPDSLIQL